MSSSEQTTPSMSLDKLDSLDRLGVMRDAKAVAVVYLPVHACADCEEDRPHIVTDHYCTCVACGRTLL